MLCRLLANLWRLYWAALATQGVVRITFTLMVWEPRSTCLPIPAPRSSCNYSWERAPENLTLRLFWLYSSPPQNPEMMLKNINPLLPNENLFYFCNNHTHLTYVCLPPGFWMFGCTQHPVKMSVLEGTPFGPPGFPEGSGLVPRASMCASGPTACGA